MPDFIVDEGGVAYDNRTTPKKPHTHRQEAHTPRQAEVQEEFQGSWWVAVVLLFSLALIMVAVFVNKSVPLIETCSGPDCVGFPMIFLVVLTALAACFIFNASLAKEFRGFRYLTAGLLFLILADYGLAGSLNWWYEGRHYIVETINKSTKQILWTTEPSNSTLFSFVYLLSPLPFFIPDLIRLVRKRLPQ